MLQLNSGYVQKIFFIRELVTALVGHKFLRINIRRSLTFFLFIFFLSTVLPPQPFCHLLSRIYTPSISLSSIPIPSHLYIIYIAIYLRYSLHLSRSSVTISFNHLLPRVFLIFFHLFPSIFISLYLPSAIYPPPSTLRYFYHIPLHLSLYPFISFYLPSLSSLLISTIYFPLSSSFISTNLYLAP